jgi:hypothetical protein
VRLPKDPENWTGIHAEQLLAKAHREFERYEARINFELPQAEQDAIYEPYRQARATAVEVARYTNWCVREAEMLP